MAVPTLTSVTPAEGPTAGDTLVSLVGTNFRVAVIPPTGFSDGLFKQTVLVLFDGAPAADAKCFDPTFVTCIPPPHADGAVNVTILNIDPATGIPVVGEQATLAAGYTYAHPIHTIEAESDLSRLVRTILRLFKRGLMLDEVTYAVQTDYDPATGDELHVTKFAKLPGLSLVGPELVENRFYSLNEQPTYDDASTKLSDNVTPATFVETRVPYTVDALFDVIVASDNKVELLNLKNNFVAFMHRNKFLFMDRDSADPSKGQVRYEFDFQPDGQPKWTSTPNNSNLRSFTARILVRGFDIETMSGFDIGTLAGVPDQAIVSRGNATNDLSLDPAVQSGISSRVGPSPGE